MRFTQCQSNWEDERMTKILKREKFKNNKNVPAAGCGGVWELF